MFGRSVKLFKIFGFEIKADLSWMVLAFLIAWSLAVGWFPEFYSHLSPFSYWGMGAAGAVGFFLSIIVHELTHSLMARLYGVFIRSITLFVFGGVSQMEDDPPSYAADFWMAIVGPLSNAVLSGLLFVTLEWGRESGWSVAVTGVLAYLAWLNLILALFNLAPAFPLDGGRILRSILWRLKADFEWATSVAVKVGAAFGGLLLIAGAFSRRQAACWAAFGGGWWASSSGWPLGGLIVSCKCGT